MCRKRRRKADHRVVTGNPYCLPDPVLVQPLHHPRLVMGCLRENLLRDHPGQDARCHRSGALFPVKGIFRYPENPERAVVLRFLRPGCLQRHQINVVPVRHPQAQVPDDLRVRVFRREVLIRQDQDLFSVHRSLSIVFLFSGIQDFIPVRRHMDDAFLPAFRGFLQRLFQGNCPVVVRILNAVV